jgi:hypothetical protein
MKPVLVMLIEELREERKIMETSRRVYLPPAKRATRIKFLNDAVKEIERLAMLDKPEHEVVN